MSFINTLIDSVSTYNEKRARVLALAELKRMPARELADLGFDSFLLDEGVKGWPWRVEKDEMAELKMIWSNTSPVNAPVADHSEEKAEESQLAQVA